MGALSVKSQTVDPETFPIVNTGIESKYLYTNTGGEGKILIDSIISLSQSAIPVIYDTLVALINDSRLVGGSHYILTDFQTIYDQMDFDAGGSLKSGLTTKMGSIEPLLLFAINESKISDNAYSTIFPKDELQYDYTYVATVANGSPAKGRISERIDEWNNRTDYDHRVVEFIRYDDGSGNFTSYKDNGNASQEFLTFGNSYATNTGEIIANNYIDGYNSIKNLLGQELSNNVFSSSFMVSNKFSSVCFNNTIISDEFYNVDVSGWLSNCIVKGKFNTTVVSGKIRDNTFQDIQRSVLSGVMQNCYFDGGINTSNIFGNISNSLFVGVTDGYISGTIYNSSFGLISETVISGGITDCNFSDIETTSISGIVINTSFNTHLQECTLDGCSIDGCSFSGANPIRFLSITGTIQNKTVNDTSFPLIFTNAYSKNILQASSGDVYLRYFDGTTDINTLIP